MKYFYLFIFILSANFGVAQLTDGTNAPDFTITDINGQSFNLYNDALSQGKFVFIDFFATWCPPCWNDVQDGVTQYVEQNFGPNAACGDQIVTLAIEADLQTTLADVLGTGNNTLGDWTSNNSYRVFNPTNSEVISSYAVNEYPTYYLICPNGLIYNQPNFYIGGISVSCLDCQYPNDVELLNINDADCTGSTYTAEVGFRNINIPNLSSFEVYYSVDGGEESNYTWTGNLNLGASSTFTLPSLTIAPGAHQYKVRIEMPNNIWDENGLNNCKNYGINAIGNLPFTNFLETFDGPELPEDNWIIVGFFDDLEWRYSDVHGGCMVMPGWEYFETIDYDIYAWTYLIGLGNLDTPYFTMDYAYSNYPGTGNDDGIQVDIASSCQLQTIFNKSGANLATAPSINSEFIPTDDQWETFCYDLSDFAGQNINIEIYGDYEFGNNIYLDNIGIVTNNCFLSLAELQAKANMLVYPNPAADRFQIESPLLISNDAEVTILNSQGQLTHRFNAKATPNGRITCDASSWPNGIYLIDVSTPDQKTTTKFVITHH